MTNGREMSLMAHCNDGRATARIPNKALIGYFLLTFGITWGVIGSYVLMPERTSALFGEISGSHPLFFLATWAPAIAAVVLVIAFGGITGLRAFLSRLLLWRISAGWVVFVFLGLPLVFVAGSLIKGGPILAPAAFEDASATVAVMFMMLFLGPVEELGWRGVLQPLLQRRLAPIWAGALVGAIWGIWHLPAFFLSGTVFGGWGFLPFFVGNVVLAVLVTPILNGTRGSLFWPMLFHWQLINPFWPDAQPLDTWILVAVAVIVVWWNRETLFTKDYAVTEVIPASGADIPRTAI
jgi:membrane protease YdiL (CAAX protease family)